MASFQGRARIRQRRRADDREAEEVETMRTMRRHKKQKDKTNHNKKLRARGSHDRYLPDAVIFGRVSLLTVESAGRPRADRVEVGDLLLGDNVLVVGPRVQELALFVEALLFAAEQRAVFRAPEVGLQARAVGEAVQVHSA